MMNLQRRRKSLDCTNWTIDRFVVRVISLVNLTAVLTHVKRWEFLFLDSGAIRVRIPPVQGSYLFLFWAGNLNFYRPIAPLLLTERGDRCHWKSDGRVTWPHVGASTTDDWRPLFSVNNFVYQTPSSPVTMLSNVLCARRYKELVPRFTVRFSQNIDNIGPLLVVPFHLRRTFPRLFFQVSYINFTVMCFLFGNFGTFIVSFWNTGTNTWFQSNVLL
jgi:hypothetical protein